MKTEEIRKMSIEEMQAKLSDMREELMKLRFQQITGQADRIGIEQPDPLYRFNGGKPFQKMTKILLFFQIFSISCCILSC